MWSVKTASACFGSVTTWKMWSFGQPVGQVLVHARGHRQQVHGVARWQVRAHASAPEQEKTAERFIALHGNRIDNQ